MEIDGTEVVALDSDGDGLSNEYEEANGLDPNDADSDDDGLSDGDEVLTHNSNPYLPIQMDTFTTLLK